MSGERYVCQSWLLLFTCLLLLQALSEQVKTIQKEVLSSSVSFDKSRHGDVAKRAADMNRVWERFLFRVENRKHVLTVAWNFFKYINDVS